MNIIAAILAAAAFLPETSPRTILNNPLSPGEVAVYQEKEFTTATIYVGGETGEVRRVSEPTAIKGYRLEQIPEDELSIVWDDSITYSNREWSIEENSGNIVITTRGGEPIADYSYMQYCGKAGISPANHMVCTDNLKDNQLTIYISASGALSVDIKDLKIWRVAFGDVPYTNDLQKITYTMKDELGVFDMKDVRKWAKNLYNGNRGEDWAKYLPKVDVDMKDRAIAFGKDIKRYAIQENPNTNLVINAGDYEAMSVRFYGTSTFSNAFRVTAIDTSQLNDGIVVLTYSLDTDDFDAAEFHVEYRESLESGSWAELSSSAYTLNTTSHTVTIPNQTSSSGFYRLKYTGTASNIVEVRFQGNVIIEDALILKGTDGVYYKISVNGGVISATAVE